MAGGHGRRAQADYGRRRTAGEDFQTCHCTATPYWASSVLMRTQALLILLLYACTATQAGDFKLYAALTEDSRVQLSDGAVWQMDKGDVFPVEAYKNQQKNVILRLAGATFMIETARTRVLKAEEVQDGIEVYRKNV